MEINLNSKKAYKDIGIMVIIALITQIISLIKLSIVASKFGVSNYMDAFNFANSIATFIFSFIGAGITTVLIPAFISKKEIKTINNFITILYCVAFFIVLIVILNRYNLVNYFRSGSKEFISISCNLLVISLLTQFMNTFISVFSAVFQSNGKFNIPKLITLICNLMMTIMLIINSNLNIYEYSLIIFIFSFINFIAQYYFVRKCEYRYNPVIDLKDKELRRMIRVFLPTLFSCGLYNISLLIDSMLSSRLGEGSISILNYSNSIISMINMLLISNIVTYLYPKIAKEITKGNKQCNLFDYIIFVNGLIILVVIGLIIIGKEGISILYQRGEFTEDVTNTVYVCFLIYSIGMPLDTSRDLIYRYFYANDDTKATFYNSVVASIINILISIILSRYIGIYGLIIGTVIASYLSLIRISIRLNSKYSIKCDYIIFTKEILKIIVSAVLTLIIVFTLKQLLYIYNLFLSCIFFGICTVIIYYICLKILNSSCLYVKI